MNQWLAAYLKQVQAARFWSEIYSLRYLQWQVLILICIYDLGTLIKVERNKANKCTRGQG